MLFAFASDRLKVMMGFSSERMLLDLFVGLPLLLCLVPLLFKVVDWIDTRYDTDLTGWRRTLLIGGVLVGTGIVLTLLLNKLCAFMGMPVDGPWAVFMF